MIRQNLHTHTIYDDGKNTPLEMAEAAMAAGLDSLGFSGHSCMLWDNDWGMTEKTLPLFAADVARVREALAGKLQVYYGLEWDLLSPVPQGFDYIIGSIHHVVKDGAVLSVDESPEATRWALEEHFDNDPDAFAEAYFAQYADLAGRDFVDITGHFDLLTKFDERFGFFRPESPRYQDAAMAALEALLRADKLFEVNTGAISRGWRTAPYPSEALLRELLARKARVLISADAHSADAVACAFPETEALLKRLGFRELWELTDRGFAPRAL